MDKTIREIDYVNKKVSYRVGNVGVDLLAHYDATLT
jgi:hypothetical protein